MTKKRMRPTIFQVGANTYHVRYAGGVGGPGWYLAVERHEGSSHYNELVGAIGTMEQAWELADKHEAFERNAK